MNNNDAQRTFRSLAEILRASELGWLVDEAITEIRQGKPKEKKVKLAPSSELVLITEEPGVPQKRSATFVESVEYTPLEQLDLLLSAFERGIIAPTDMEDEVAHVLSKALQSPTANLPPIRFEFLAEGEDEQSRECTAEDRDHRRAVALSLSGILRRCREAIHAAD
jgi:hypothetical protein